jgi:hypothetical protein
MHLSECLAISPFHSSDERAELSSCLSKWLFRSTTEFYDQDVNLPWYFGALCLSYTIGGLGMFIVKPKWTRRSNYPYVSFALFLAFVQGSFQLFVVVFHLSASVPLPRKLNLKFS